MSVIADRLVTKLKALKAKHSSFKESDLDELRILHSHVRNEFPETFNKIMRSFQFTTVTMSQENFLDRLLRVLEVESQIPPELRLPSSDINDSDELIPTFSLEKKDISRIAELCSAMRKIVFATAEFDFPHRKRLLNRIAAIEAEVHKSKGLFDVIRGGMNDLGETLGKFGTDIKPLTDRMQEVVKIARGATKEYDQLPPPDEVKKLPKPEDFEQSGK